jgi:hypothetical protein
MADMELSELLKQYDELGDMIVKLGGKKKDPKSENADVTADGASNTETPPVKNHDQKVKKAKKKTAMDEEDLSDGGDDEDTEDMEKVAKAAEADEAFDFNGQSIKKSAVGDVQFGIMKGMAEQVAKSAADIAKAQDETLTARLEKRADEEYAHVPGTTSERASMLKAIEKMDEATKKSFEAVLKSHEKLSATAFGKLGTSGGDSEDLRKARGNFEGKVTEIKKRDNCSKTEAMAKARSEHPELFKAYQEAQTN